MNIKTSLKSLLAVFALALVVSEVQAASGAGPYYATPSWAQKLQCDTTATCPRFIVLTNWNNEAVLDRETGLVWEQSPRSQTFAQDQASISCVGTRKGDRNGWRLPSIQELSSLLENARAGLPTLPEGHPFNVQKAVYWSATSYIADANAAWFVDFARVYVSVGLKSDSNHVWCVRGGPGVNPQ